MMCDRSYTCASMNVGADKQGGVTWAPAKRLLRRQLTEKAMREVSMEIYQLNEMCNRSHMCSLSRKRGDADPARVMRLLCRRMTWRRCKRWLSGSTS